MLCSAGATPACIVSRRQDFPDSLQEFVTRERLGDRSLGAELGYLFSAPKPAAEARRLLGARLEAATAVA
jgi:hypothetical protein